LVGRPTLKLRPPALFPTIQTLFLPRRMLLRYRRRVTHVFFFPLQSSSFFDDFFSIPPFPFQTSFFSVSGFQPPPYSLFFASAEFPSPSVPFLFSCSIPGCATRPDLPRGAFFPPPQALPSLCHRVPILLGPITNLCLFFPCTVPLYPNTQFGPPEFRTVFFLVPMRRGSGFHQSVSFFFCVTQSGCMADFCLPTRSSWVFQCVKNPSLSLFFPGLICPHFFFFFFFFYSIATVFPLPSLFFL